VHKGKPYKICKYNGEYLHHKKLDEKLLPVCRPLSALLLLMLDRLAILQEQFNNLFEVMIQLVQGFPLRMGAVQSRNISDKQPGVGTLLNDGGIDSHVPLLS
jgi:hypothetical protein